MPNVLCWESLVADEAARVFSVAFFEALQQDGSYDLPQLQTMTPTPAQPKLANPKPKPAPEPEA